VPSPKGEGISAKRALIAVVSVSQAVTIWLISGPGYSVAECLFDSGRSLLRRTCVSKKLAELAAVAADVLALSAQVGNQLLGQA
jgi:hypothetical protein